MIHIHDKQILEVTDIRQLIDFMALNYARADTDDVSIPLRSMVRVEEPESVFVSMPAYSKSHGLFIAKTGSVFVRKSSDPNKRVHTMITAFSTESGQPVATFHGDAITNLKCAAITGLVTALCTNDKARTLGIIGCGTQALGQLQGVAAVRDIRRVHIFSRTKDNVDKFIDNNRHLFSDISIIGCNSSVQCIQDVDIISTATISTEPVIDSHSVLPYLQHINCFGNHTPSSREVPRELMEKSTLIVEDLDTAIKEAGSIHTKALTIHQASEKYRERCRKSRTIFSSTGHALLDLITVNYVLKKLNIDF